MPNVVELLNLEDEKLIISNINFEFLLYMNNVVSQSRHKQNNDKTTKFVRKASSNL
jgi:hypothetical protein